MADLTRKVKFAEGCDCGCNDPISSDPFEMLEFLMHRMNGAGVGEAVAESYAWDIYQILKAHDKLGCFQGIPLRMEGRELPVRDLSGE